MTNFGRETSCTTEYRSGRFVSGPRLVAEALYRRFTTPRGTLRGGEAEQNFGKDLAALVGRVRSKADIAALPGEISNEAKKDERVESVEVAVVDVSTSTFLKSFEITIDGTTAEGPFSLQMLVSSLSVELVGVKA